MFLFQVIDKKAKKVSQISQHCVISLENNKQINDDKVHHDSVGLSLRTRTISSTTIPVSLHQPVVPSTSVQSKCSSVVKGTRPRGRPPRKKNINNVINGTTSQITLVPSEESKICDSVSSVVGGESDAAAFERLQQPSIKQCNGVEHHKDEQKEKSNTKITSTSVEINNKHSTLIVSQLAELDKNKECSVVDETCKKKITFRKRKNSDVIEVVPIKRSLVAGNIKDPLVPEKNLTVKSSLQDRQTSVDDLEYGFLAGYNVIEPYQLQSVKRVPSASSPICYGHTYWPTSWEYSSTLTSHVQKKASKEALRKIRVLSGVGVPTKTGSSTAPSLKTNFPTKKYYTSVTQRRGSANKLSALTSVEITGGFKSPLTSSITVKRKGRPPGRKNKILQTVIKSNSPRKSPRQHASTLAAIMSKVQNSDTDVTEEPDKIVDIDVHLESNKNSIDLDGPCVLTMAVPKNEYMSGVRRQRHRRQLNLQRDVTKRRRRRRSITPPPPKLCVQQPAPQRSSINAAADHEVVKLRTKHVDIVKRRARDERLRAAFVCQHLRLVRETAERNQRELAQEVKQSLDEELQDYQFSSNAIVIPSVIDQDQVWTRKIDSQSNQEPDNMCVQIMYEQTADMKFLCADLPNEALQMYHQQRDLALTECLTSNYSGDTVSSDLIHHLCTDPISANKRKKKRPNMTGWPKEKRRKVMVNSSSMNLEEVSGNSDIKNDIVAKRRKLAEQQRLRRQRLKLEQQQAKEKSKVKVATTPVTATARRRGRRPGPIKKTKTATYRRTASINSNVTNTSNTSTITPTKEKKLTIHKQRQQRIPVRAKSPAVSIAVTPTSPNTGVKRSCGRPRGSVGRRKRITLQLQQRRQNQTSLSSEQHKENVIQPQTTGKLKCVISTRNNRMKLLSNSSSASATSNQKKLMGSKTKKSAYNLSPCLMSPSSPVAVASKTTRTTVKRRKLQQQQQHQMASVAWDVGRPKRYHATNNHSRGVAVEEDCCFVGSQPFEQHCPGGGNGLSHNTVLENHHDHHKEHILNVGL